MRVLITGGGGFLGGQLARRILSDPGGPDVVVLDRQAAALDPAAVPGGRLRHVVGDLFEPAALASALDGVDRVVHLASVVSADAEADPERAWTTNVDGLRLLLRACEERAPGCPFVFASSVAVFDGEAGPAGDGVKHRPRSTYGMTKAIGELLVDEASRRGVVDGRSARLPTVIVRPGRPNLAASSFASGLFREPLAGQPSVVPVAPATGLVVIGHRTAVDGLHALLELPAGALGPDRAVGLPGLATSVEQMLAALARAGERHGRRLGAVEVAPDHAIEAIVASWPAAWDHTRALALGLPADGSLDDIVDAYLADFGAAGDEAGG
jgi:nucleoside-diphosphate-sugar epimerase